MTLVVVFLHCDKCLKETIKRWKGIVEQLTSWHVGSTESAMGFQTRYTPQGHAASDLLPPILAGLIYYND
jgi:hypothetical protein